MKANLNQILKNEDVLAGSISLEGVIEVKVSKLYNDSSVSRILELVAECYFQKS